MRAATSPAWSPTTWRLTSGTTCRLCRSLWPLTLGPCTTARSTYQVGRDAVRGQFCFLLFVIGVILCCLNPLGHRKSSLLDTRFCLLCVSGGVHNGEYVSWLYCYDPVMDVWARKQDMNTKRAIHALAGMNDRLYAIGGNHLKGTRGSISQMKQKTGQHC